MKKIILPLIIIIIFIVSANTVFAEKEKNLVNIYFFHSDTCSHCKEEMKLLKKLEKKYENINIYKYEINSDNNKELYEKVANEYKIETQSVPLTVIGDKYFIGYSEEKTKLTFIKTIAYYSTYGYVDKTADIVGNSILPSYEVTEAQIDIEKFLKEYGNYKILFFETNDLSLEISNLLTTLLSELSIYNILMITILVFLISKLKNSKEKLISIFIYTSIYIVQNLLYQIDILIANKIIMLLSLNYFAYSILMFAIKNKKENIIYSIVVIISIIANYIKLNYHYKYLNIFKELIELNSISTLEYIIQLLLNIMFIITITMILIYIVDYIMKKIKIIVINDTR